MISFAVGINWELFCISTRRRTHCFCWTVYWGIETWLQPYSGNIFQSRRIAAGCIPWTDDVMLWLSRGFMTVPRDSQRIWISSVPLHYVISDVFFTVHYIRRFFDCVFLENQNIRSRKPQNILFIIAWHKSSYWKYHINGFITVSSIFCRIPKTYPQISLTITKIPAIIYTLTPVPKHRCPTDGGILFPQTA